MKFLEYPDAEMMMIDLANQLAGELSNYVTHHDSATFAVPGGTTPGPPTGDRNMPADLKVLVTTAEVQPLIKTGGLADVAGRVKTALKDAETAVTIIAKAEAVPDAGFPEERSL